MFIKIKPILDAYCVPFCKNTRYSVGLLLLVKTSLSITYSALSNRECTTTTFLLILSSILFGIALIPWLQEIYQTKFFGVLEGSFVINIVTTYHIIIQEYESHQLIVFYTSICLAFIEILTILFFHVWHRLNLKWLYMKYCISCLIRKIEICFI